MPSNYTGDSEVVQSPSPAHAPGADVVVALPTGGEARNAASVYQPFKVLADVSAFFQASLRLEKPANPSTTSGIGRMFSNVTQVGGGSGTVKPTGGAAMFGYRYMVKITLAGATGVAKYRVSTDGGKTYGAEITTAASVTDASGAVLAFVGTFVLDDTYSFRGIDTPLAMWHEPGGKARELIDHNGIPFGQLTSFREDWSHGVTAALDTTPASTFFPGYSRWKYVLDAGGVAPSPVPTIAYQSPSSDALGNFNSLLITGSTAAGSIISHITHARSLAVARPTSTATFSCRWLVRAPQNGASQVAYIGLSASASAMTSANPFGAMFKFTGAGNWFAQVWDDDDVTAVLSVDSGIAPNTGAAADWQLLQIEYYGPDSPVGVALGAGIWRFLIDGVQVGIVAYDALVASLQPFMRQDSTANTPAISLDLGPVSWGVPWLNDPVRI